MNKFDVSVVIPAYNEIAGIQKTLDLIHKLQNINIELIIVVDSEEDLTINAVATSSQKPENTKVVIQTYGGGPANAIRFGINIAISDCVLVTMADGSDDVRVIPDLTNLVNRGVSVACASRYMSGGQQIGGPRIKKFLSKTAGKILYTFAGVGTHDPTNSYKAYSKSFISKVGIESRSGFEIGIELVAKAKRNRLAVAEIPTIWLDRTAGTSRFQLTKWLPKYLRWFFHCFGPSRNLNEE